MDLVTQRVPTARVPWRAVGLLALIALLLAATIAVYVGSQQRRLPAPFGPAANGSIVYVSDGDVFVRSTVDGPSAPLITGPETETYAFFAPSGERLAVLRMAEGGEEVWVADSAGAGLRRIGGPYDAIDWIEWSPDGRYIALSYDRRAVNAIDILESDGSGSRRLVDIPAMSPTWRPPDGSQLLFRGQEAGRWGFYLVDAAGGEPMRLDIDGDGRQGGGYDLNAPAWSPTGDRLAYHTLVSLPGSQLQTPGFRIEVATVAVDGTLVDRRPLEFSAVADDELNPVFTPDGTQLLYQQRMGWTPPDPASGVPTIDTLWLASADGTGPARDLGITSRDGDGFTVVVAPDGRSLLVHLWKENEEWLVDPATATATKTDIASSTVTSWQRKAP